MIVFFNRKFFRLKPAYFAITALLIINICVWHSAFHRSDLLKITFLDVGHGDSAFVEFPGSGATMLIDGGKGYGGDMGRYIVEPFLRSRGVNKIDVVLATHPDEDHAGGLATIIKKFKVRYFIDNGDESGASFYSALKRIIKERGIKSLIVKRGDRIKGFGDAEAEVLNPPAEKFPDKNNNSIVLKLAYDDFSALLCADVEGKAAREIAYHYKEKLDSDVCKVPHHGGSLGNFGREFITKISPEIAVISLGYRGVNRSTGELLRALKVRVYRTDTDGAVCLTTDGKRYKVKKFVKN
ncbi:MAG: MBL fold metallo-hydrolase [Candidatus Omnitrophota bacterium]